MKTILSLAAMSAFLIAGPAMAGSCPAVTKPVCAAGTDGHRSNLPSACRAEQKGYIVLHDGECEAPDPASACPHLMSPICATDPTTGKPHTYPNMCTAEVANAPYLGSGECAPKPPPAR